METKGTMKALVRNIKPDKGPLLIYLFPLLFLTT
jgi:hypothetical protein